MNKEESMTVTMRGRFAREQMLPAIGLVLGMATVSACKSDDTDTPPNMMQPPPTMMPDAKGSGEITGVRPVSQGLMSPFDATPSPKGDKVYFTAMTEDVGALFAAEVGGTAREIAGGFAAPIGVVISTDGETVFVADIGVDNPEAEDEDGMIYSVPAAGGDKSELGSTKGYEPRSMDLREVDGDDVLFFTGNDPSDGQPGIFSVSTRGGSVSVVVKGAPLMDPSGLAVTAEGDIYVADTTGSTNGKSGVFKYTSGAGVLEFVPGLRVGYPAGVALTHDEAFLLVSGHEANSAQAAVHKVKLSDKTVQTITSGIEGNTEAGGVHRAHEADTYAWANSDDPDENGMGGGTVYLLGTKANPLP